MQIVKTVGIALLTLSTLSLPLFLLATSWILDQWPALIFAMLAVAIAGVLLIGFAISPFEFRLHWSTAAPVLAASIGLLQIQMGATANPYATLQAVYVWAGMAALYWMAQQFFALNYRLRQYFPAGALFFSTIYAIYAIVQWFTSGGRIFWHFDNRVGVDRVLGTILNRNHYAAFIELSLPAVFWYFLESPRRNPHAAIAAGVLFASIVASTSRAGFMIATLELILVYLLRSYWESRSEGHRESSGIYAIGAAAVLLTFTAAIGIGPLQERLLGQRASEALADYGQSRWEYADASVQMIRARPLTGFGLGTWPEIYPAYGTYDSADTHVNHAHNDPVEWLAEGGLIFLAPLIILLAAAIRAGFQQPWALGPLAVLLHSLFDFPLQKPAILAFLFLFLAVGIEQSRRRQ